MSEIPLKVSKVLVKGFEWMRETRTSQIHRKLLGRLVLPGCMEEEELYGMSMTYRKAMRGGNQYQCLAVQQLHLVDLSM